MQHVVSHRIIERVYYTYSNVGSSTQILCTFIHLTVRPPTQDFGVPQKRRRYIVFFLLLLSIHLCQTKQLWDLTDPAAVHPSRFCLQESAKLCFVSLRVNQSIYCRSGYRNKNVDSHKYHAQPTSGSFCRRERICSINEHRASGTFFILARKDGSRQAVSRSVGSSRIPAQGFARWRRVLHPRSISGRKGGLFGYECHHAVGSEGLGCHGTLYGRLKKGNLLPRFL